MRRLIWSVCISVLVFVPIFTIAAMQPPQSADARAPSDTPAYQLFIPGVQQQPTFTPTPTPTPTPGPSSPAPGLEWDPRLTLRYATFSPATVQPGYGYWKLIKGVWYSPQEVINPPFGVGDHGIHYDVQDPAGVRQVGKPMKITWQTDGSCATGLVVAEGLAPWLANVACTVYVSTESKTGELYAGGWGMNHVAPTYKIQVDDGSPSDAVDGLGMGSLEQPGMKIHTSYGFIWRWTMYYLFNTTQVASCLPQAAGTWFDGKVYLQGQPLNGQRVVFASQPDGAWASEPAITGPTPLKPYDDPGHYSHIIRAPGDGPLAGDWYVWIVDANDTRISAIARWHSDGPVPEGTGCNEAVVNFDS